MSGRPLFMFILKSWTTSFSASLMEIRTSDSNLTIVEMTNMCRFESVLCFGEHCITNLEFSKFSIFIMFLISKMLGLLTGCICSNTTDMIMLLN